MQSRSSELSPDHSMIRNFLIPSNPNTFGQDLLIIHWTIGLTEIEPFMEWKIHMDNGMEWIMGGYGKFLGKERNGTDNGEIFLKSINRKYKI